MSYTWWKEYANRFAGRASVPTLNELEIFKANYLRDLYPVAQKVAFPTMSYSIKDLDDDTRKEAREGLDSYNRDDVKATFAVRNYMRGLSL